MCYDTCSIQKDKTAFLVYVYRGQINNAFVSLQVFNTSFFQVISKLTFHEKQTVLG